MTKKSNLTNIIIYFVLIIVLLIMAFPIIYTISSSFKTNMEIMSQPEKIFSEEPTFENYIQAWNSDLLQIGPMFFNSVVFTLLSVIITLITSSVYGYVFSRGDFAGKKLIFGIFSALMFISLGSITVYPLMSVFNALGMKGNLWSLLVYKFFSIPVVNIFLVKGFINSLPKEIDEAAMIDGCGFVSTFIYIILPLLKPILATIGILSFQAAWNEYLLPAVFTLTNPKQQTLIVGIMGLKSSGEAAASWNLMFAGSTFALIPILVVYLIGNKYFVRSIAAGAVKG